MKKNPFNLRKTELKFYFKNSQIKIKPPKGVNATRQISNTADTKALPLL